MTGLLKNDKFLHKSKKLFGNKFEYIDEFTSLKIFSAL
jgi:hypothetical protein